MTDQNNKFSGFSLGGNVSGDKKQCTKCGEWKVFSAFTIRWRREKTVGCLCSVCKECMASKAREWNEEHGQDSDVKERRRAYAQQPEQKEKAKQNLIAWRKKNPEKRREQSKRHRERCLTRQGV